jgi:hypothetical protein
MCLKYYNKIHSLNRYKILMVEDGEREISEVDLINY